MHLVDWRSIFDYRGGWNYSNSYYSNGKRCWIEYAIKLILSTLQNKSSGQCSDWTLFSEYAWRFRAGFWVCWTWVVVMRLVERYLSIAKLAHLPAYWLLTTNSVNQSLVTKRKRDTSGSFMQHSDRQPWLSAWKVSAESGVPMLHAIVWSVLIVSLGCVARKVLVESVGHLRRPWLDAIQLIVSSASSLRF